MNSILSRIFSGLSVAFAAILLTAIVFEAKTSAQSSSTLTSEGVSGDIDTKHRSPVLSVTPVIEPNVTKLLVDAYEQNPDYKHLPMRFDFYINRQFFTSQVRSSELPGAIGIDIGTDRAPRPFNYTVIAVLLHPNREFTTVIHGAVFDSNLTRTVDCTLTTGVNGEDSIEYVANDISTTQTENGSFTIAFEEQSVSDDHEVNFSAAVSISGESATGKLTFSQDSGESKTVDSEGDVAISDDDELTSLTLTSEDGDVTLNCS